MTKFLFLILFLGTFILSFVQTGFAQSPSTNGLTYWYAPSDIVNFANPVLTLPNKVNNISQQSATYEGSGGCFANSSWFAGAPAMNFDHDDAFRIHYSTGSTADVSYSKNTIVLGLQTENFHSEVQTIYKFSNSDYGINLWQQNNVLYFDCYGQNNSTLDFNRLEYGVAANSEYVITASFNGDAKFMELFVDGKSVARKSTLISSFNLPGNYHGWLGGFAVAGSGMRTSATTTSAPYTYWWGKMASILIYNNKTLSNIERLQSEEYIRVGTTGLQAPNLFEPCFSCTDGNQLRPLVRYEAVTTVANPILDLSGNDLNATFTSTGPTSSTINNRPAYSFGTGKEIQIPSTMLFDKATQEARTYNLVIKPSDVTSRQFVYVQGDENDGMNIFIQDGLLYFTTFGGGPSVRGINQFNYPINIGETYIISIANSSSSIYIGVNGNLVANLPPAGLLVNTTRGAAGAVYLGGNTLLSTYIGPLPPSPNQIIATESPFTGAIAEFAVYDKCFTTEELAFLHNYLAGKYNVQINLNKDYYRWQEFYPSSIGGLNAAVTSSCSDELLFKTNTTPSSSTFLHIGNNAEISSATLVGEHAFYMPGYTVPQNVIRTKRTWRVDNAQAASSPAYPSFGGAMTIDFSIEKSKFPVGTILSYQKPVLLVDVDGDFSSDTKIYELVTDPVDNNNYWAPNLTVNAGDYISIGIINVYEYTATRPYSTDFIYQTNSANSSDNQININGVKIKTLGGTTDYNYMGIAVNNTTSLEFDPMLVIPAINCNWAVTQYGNIGPVEIVFDPASIGITTPLLSTEEYVLAYEPNTAGSGLGYGVFTKYIRFALVDNQYKIPTIVLPGTALEFTILKRTIPTPTKAASPLAILKENNQEISDNLTKGLLVVSGKDTYPDQYDDLAPQCPQTAKKALLYLTFNTGDNYLLGDNSFTSQVEVKVTGKTVLYAGPSLNFGNYTLNINHDNPEQLQVIDITEYINSYPFEEITVQVLSYTSTGNATFDNALEFKAEIIKETKTLVSITTDPIITTQATQFTTNNTACDFTWEAPYCKPYAYQFQLLRLFNVSTAQIPATEQDLYLAELDWNKALTLETTKNNIALTLAEGTGYYVWRVRPIGNYYEGEAANNLNWGAWNTDVLLPSTLTLSGSSDLSVYKGSVFYYNQFDEDKNFIYNRVFTEDTKVHEGISYANGLQQVNQTQAKVNSNGANGEVVVSESVYDFAGRASLQSMAAPDEQNSELGYRNTALITGTTGTDKYNAFNFDEDTKLNTPDPIDNGLINLYYSDLNTDPQIPNAEKYPYSRSLYDNDGVNRTIEQSGVGKMHSIGNKTVSFAYSTATDQELLQIFGDEAPKASTVLKTKTTDQNNVSSITYTDLSGKVIATTLVKNDKTSNLLELDNNKTFNIIDKLNNNLPLGANGVTASKTYTFSEVTNVTVDLEVSPAMVFSDCGDFCATCSYLAEIKVTDNKTNTVVDTKTISIDGAEVACSLTVGTAVEKSISIDDIPVGTYTITKTITLDESKASDYAESVKNKIDSDLQIYLNANVMNRVNAKQFQLLADDMKALYSSGVVSNGTSLLANGYTMKVKHATVYNSNDEDVTPPYVSGTIITTGDEITIGPACCAVTFPITIPELDPCEQLAYDVDHGMSEPAAALKFGLTLADLYIVEKGLDPNNLGANKIIPTHTELGDYSRADLQDLFMNMLEEYECDEIWNAWHAQISIISALSLQDNDILEDPRDGKTLKDKFTDGFANLFNNPNTAISSHFPAQDLTNAKNESSNPMTVFLSELNRADHLNGFFDEATPSSLLRRKAFKYFRYDRGTNGPLANSVAKFCEQRYCRNPLDPNPDLCAEVSCTPDRVQGTPGVIVGSTGTMEGYTLKYTFSDASTFTLSNGSNPIISDLYNCIRTGRQMATTEADRLEQVEEFYEKAIEQKTAMEVECKSACDTKRDDFIASLRKLYDSDNNGTLLNSNGETILESDLCCTADRLVDYCKDQCNLSLIRERCPDNPNITNEIDLIRLLAVGTPEEQNNMLAIIGGTYVLEDASNSSVACSTHYRKVESCHEMVGIYHLNGTADVKDEAHENNTSFNLTYTGSTSFGTGRTSVSTTAMNTPETFAVSNDNDTRGITNNVTVSAWVKMEAITGTNSEKIITQKMDATTSTGFKLYTKNGFAYFDVSVSGLGHSSGASIYNLETQGNGTTKDPLIQDKAWHLVTGVCRDTIVEIWIDGQYQHGIKLTSGTIGSIGCTSPLKISASTNGFEGQIDEVYLHSCALGKGAIMELYNETKSSNLTYQDQSVSYTYCGESVTQLPSKEWDRASGASTKIMGMQKVSTGKIWTYGSTGIYPHNYAHLVILDENGNKVEQTFNSYDGQFQDMLLLPNGNYALVSIVVSHLRIYEFLPNGTLVSNVEVPVFGVDYNTVGLHTLKLFLYNNQLYTVHTIIDLGNSLNTVCVTSMSNSSNYYLFKTSNRNIAYDFNKVSANRYEISGHNLFAATQTAVIKIDLSSLSSKVPGSSTIYDPSWIKSFEDNYLTIKSMELIENGNSITLTGIYYGFGFYGIPSSETYPSEKVGLLKALNLNAATGAVNWDKTLPRFNTIFAQTPYVEDPLNLILSIPYDNYSISYSMKSKFDDKIIICGSVNTNVRQYTPGPYSRSFYETSGFIFKLSKNGEIEVFLDNALVKPSHNFPSQLETFINYQTIEEDEIGNIFGYGYRGSYQGAVNLVAQNTDQMIVKLNKNLTMLNQKNIFGSAGRPDYENCELELFDNGSLLLGMKSWDDGLVTNFSTVEERTAPTAGNSYVPPYQGEMWFLSLANPQPTACTSQPVCIKFIPSVKDVVPIDPDPIDPTPTPKDILKKQIGEIIFDQLGQCALNNLSAIYNEYTTQCKAKIVDDCTVKYNTTLAQYTLYYYDRAGNLVKTVPPEGVELVTIDPLDVEAARQVLPDHRMVTSYKYNSLGQLVEQTTPDGGTSYFRYNALGMLRFSQNEQQLSDGTYSYTKFDALGRTIEVGQASLASGETFATLPAEAQGAYTAFEHTSFPTLNTSQETFTVYNAAATHVNYLGAPQKYLRNRVSYTFAKGMDGHKSVSYFSYDPHGNVKWMVQELPGIGKSTIAYDYDLISNKVLKVKLNENRSDQFFHRYFYDSDNRITSVQTSPNGYLWDTDAKYNYYKHGPLRRTEIGEDHVQGLDYTYTIQGWLKAVNAPTLDETKDPGLDGTNSSPFVKDEYGFVLGYYSAENGMNGDFNRTGSVFNADATITNVNLASDKPLYNGNITSWTTRINKENPTYQITGNTYTYDFLNRIKTSNFYNQTGTANFGSMAKYGTTYTYDGNGNLQFLTRQGESVALIDNLTYNYHTIDVNGVQKKDNNMLLSVSDASGQVVDDLDDQPTGNYDYDNIGNLISDASENSTIIWNVYGKVSEVKQKVPSVSGKNELRFVYDAMGNRIEKEVNKEPYSATLQPQRLIEKLETSYYVRDASGNVMAIYERKNAPVVGKPNYYLATYTLKEVPLYGSSRLGLQDAKDEAVVVATKQFHADDYFNITFDKVNVDQKTELNNWLTASTRIDDIGAYQVPSVSLHQVDFNSAAPVSQALQNIQDFAGVSGKDVTVAESDYGQVLFYSVTMKKHWGKQNVLLLFDADGNLMPNSGGIKADANARNVVVQSPKNTSEYLLVTRNATDHKLYYHTIDMAAQGNGPNQWDNRGAVKTKNQAFDANNTYGTYLLAIEDRAAHKAYVYTTQFKAPANAELTIGTTELILFEISNSGTSLVKAPSKLCVDMNAWEDIAQSQIQVSADGTKLTVINHKENLGWFGAQKTEAVIFNLGSNYRLSSNYIVDATVIPIGISMPHQSADFSADSRFFYYTQQRLTAKPAFNTLGRFDLRNKVQSQNLFLSQLPQVQRSKYGMVYAYENNAWNAYMQNAEGISLTSPIDNMNFSLAAGQNMQRILPLQNRVVYKQTEINPLLFSRRVGKKNYEMSDHLGNVTVVVSDRLDVGPDALGSNLVVNGEMTNTTAGLADNWLWTISGDPSIVTGSGFTGNAQRIDISSGKTRLVIKNLFPVVSGKNYRISFKYRASKSFRSTGNTAATNNFLDPNVPANTAAAVVYTYDAVANGNEIGIFFDMQAGVPGVDWLEIDDVSVMLIEADGIADYNVAHVETFTNYYAFGMAMPGRKLNSDDYRYGFNGKEKDTEGMGGGGSTYDYGFRIYNPQIAKFLSVDPLTKTYPFYTPYQFASNTPIMASDLDGAESEVRIYGNGGAEDPTQVITNANEIAGFMKAYGAGYSGDANDILLYTPGEYGATYMTESVAGSLPTLSDQLKGSQYINKSEATVKEVPSTKVGGYGKGPLAGTFMDANLEGEQGLKTYSTAINNTGNSLKLVSPLTGPFAPFVAGTGEILTLGSDAIDTGLDFKNKDMGTAAINLSIRAAFFGAGKYFNKQFDNAQEVIPRSLGKETVGEQFIRQGADVVGDKIEGELTE